MNITTGGILIRRQPSREYDERTVFFTQRLGLTSIHSFGSRSPKSSRGRMMSRRDWMSLSLEKKGKRYVLERLSVLKKNRVDDNDAYLFLSEMLKAVTENLPWEEPEPELFQLLIELSPGDEIASPEFIRNRELLFRLSFLKSLGVYPYFTACLKCGESCSSVYYYDPVNSGFTGESCNPENKLYDFNADQLVWLNTFYILKQPERKELEREAREMDTLFNGQQTVLGSFLRSLTLVESGEVGA